MPSVHLIILLHTAFQELRCVEHDLMACEFLLPQLKYHVYCCVLGLIELNEVVISRLLSRKNDAFDRLLRCNVPIRKLFEDLSCGPADDRSLGFLILNVEGAVETLLSEQDYK